MVFNFQRFMFNEKFVSLSYFSLLCEDLKSLLLLTILKNKKWIEKGFIMENIDRKIYCWGENKKGQLGIGNKINFLLPHSFNYEIENNVKIRQIGCGTYHSMLLTQDGNCYSFGTNDYGQLGVDGNIDYLTRPTKLKENDNVSFDEIIVGAYHNFAIGKNKQTNRKEFYCWGYNSFGQLGLKHNKNQYIPIIFDFKFKNGILIREIKCEIFSTVFILEDKSCYASGKDIFFKSDNSRIFVCSEKPKQIDINEKYFQKIVFNDNITLEYESIDIEMPKLNDKKCIQIISGTGSNYIFGVFIKK